MGGKKGKKNSISNPQTGGKKGKKNQNRHSRISTPPKNSAADGQATPDQEWPKTQQELALKVGDENSHGAMDAQNLVHIMTAIQSSKEIVQEVPRSVEYSFRYATLLCSLAEKVQDYLTIIQECERGLSIEDPSYLPRDGGCHDQSIEPSEQRTAEFKAKLCRIMEQAELELRKRGINNYKVVSFWEMLSPNQKLAFQQIRISHVREFLKSSQNSWAEDILSEAVDFVKENKTWKFWACSSCNKKFPNSDLLLEHLWKDLIEEVPVRHRAFLPLELHKSWVGQFYEIEWKPMNFLEDESEEEPKIEDCGGLTLADDALRGSLLQEIQDMFQFLIKQEYLVSSHLEYLMGYTMKYMDKKVAASKLLACGLSESPKCICFLEIPQLQNIFYFLKGVSEIVEECGSKLPEVPTWIDDAQRGRQGYKVDTEVTLTDDSFCLHFDHVPGKVLQWLFPENRAVEDQLNEWGCCCATQEEIGTVINGKNCQIGRTLQLLCNVSCELLMQSDAALMMASHCNEEFLKRSNVGEHVPQSFISVLKSKEEYFSGLGANAMGMSWWTRVLSMVVEAKKVNQQSGYGELESSCVPLVHDLFLGIVSGDSMMLENVEEDDADILRGILSVAVAHSIELFRTTATMLLTNARARKYHSKLSQSSCGDYGSIVLPVLRMFLQEHMEDLVARQEQGETMGI